jgi:hypothetical protein
MGKREQQLISQLPEYSEASVRSLYTDFQQQRGRFQPQPSYEQPVDAPAVATVAPVAADVAGTTAAANSRRGPHGLISIPCQLQIFSSRYAEDVRLNRTLGAIGKDLHAQVSGTPTTARESILAYLAVAMGEEVVDQVV